MRWIAAALLGILLVHSSVAGAAKRVPLGDAVFEGNVGFTTDLTVGLAVTTFDPAEQRWEMLAVGGGAYVPLSGKVKSEFLFSVQDQQELAGILVRELQRHGVVGDQTTDAAELMIDLRFIEGAYRQSINEYVLVVDMMLSDAAGHRFDARYTVNSNANASRWQRLNTSVWKGKQQLVSAALEQLIPDIQMFLANGRFKVDPSS